MLTPFSPFSRITEIERDMSHYMTGFFGPLTSRIRSPFGRFFNPMSNFNFRSSGNDIPHVISVDLGYCYKKDDIKVFIDGNMLKVSGKAIESVRNGNNVHRFKRVFQIPEYLDTSSMRYEVNHGHLYVAFDRKYVEPKKVLENLSNDREFRMCIHFEGIKPKELSVRVVGHDLVIEGSSKSSFVSDNQQYRSCSSTYVARTIRLPDCVYVDKLKAVMSDGSLHISAPKDQTKFRQTERYLQIENA